MTPVALPSPNHDDRGGVAVSMLVLHYTGMVSAEAALSRLCDPASKVSAHYAIDEDGTVYALVPEQRRAWHAGVSFWASIRDVNSHSIGIELVNPGHEFGYRAFPSTQIEALKSLCAGILARHAIAAWNVLGHSDVAPARKQDPGELFPWADLAASGIGLWPEPASESVGSEALVRYGYDPQVPAEAANTAFQRHFRPEKLSGIWDDDCGRRLAAMLLVKT